MVDQVGSTSIPLSHEPFSTFQSIYFTKSTIYFYTKYLMHRSYQVLLCSEFYIILTCFCTNIINWTTVVTSWQHNRNLNEDRQTWRGLIGLEYLKASKPLRIKEKKNMVCSLIISRSNLTNYYKRLSILSHMNFLYGRPLSSSCICCNHNSSKHSYAHPQQIKI